MTTLLFKLAFAGIRSRLLASALTIAIAGAAAATIVLALEVRSSGRDPWQQTFDAANGAHVLAFVSSTGRRARDRRPPRRHRARRAGSSRDGEPGAAPGSTDRVELAGLSGRTAVNMPVLTYGSQLREGGIVLERSLASALGIDAGATLAVTRPTGLDRAPGARDGGGPQPAALPRRNPGLAWITRATLERMEPDRASWRWSEALRLADPSAAAAFTERAAAGFPAPRCSPASLIETWQDQRDNALADAQPIVARSWRRTPSCS